VSVEVAVTLAILVAEIGLLLFCFFQSRKPPIPGKVRVFPYTLAIIVLTLLVFLTVAHLISLLTGTQLQPKRPKGMR
jgi:ABC-type transport system involved in multi-copper enzyme maturation permease subunit